MAKEQATDKEKTIEETVQRLEIELKEKLRNNEPAYLEEIEANKQFTTSFVGVPAGTNRI